MATGAVTTISSSHSQLNSGGRMSKHCFDVSDPYTEMDRKSGNIDNDQYGDSNDIGRNGESDPLFYNSRPLNANNSIKGLNSSRYGTQSSYSGNSIIRI